MSNADLELTELDPSKDPLWARIEAYAFDALDPNERFAEKLARENRWPVKFAERAIEEYRRFCYLAIRAPHAVVPSDAVDQVWHLHLGYSREYWADWCGKVLECDLHHEPAGTGEGDVDDCRDGYETTLRTYEIISFERPPDDIWPNAELRFGRVGSMRRVSLADYLIIRRPSKGMLWIGQLLLAFGAIFALWQGEYQTAITLGVVTAAVVIYRDRTDNNWHKKPWRDGDDDGFRPGGCNGRRGM